MTTKHAFPSQETFPSETHHHLLCWKSVVGGLFISLMGILLLTSLGAGIAGFTAEGMVDRETGGSALATGAGLWLGLSIVASLFCGSYFALRISRFVTPKVGAAHGFVIASSFFLLMVFGVGNLMGGLAQGFGKLGRGASDGATGLANNPVVQDTLNKALGDSTLKSNPRDVAQGLAVRLLQGDTESAKNYYAFETGKSPVEVDAKFNQLKSDFEATTKRVGEKTARAIGDAGLSLFVVFLVGLIGAVMGGRVGAHSNVERPFARVGTTSPMAIGVLRTERGSVAPYIFGWLLGVPVSILFLIALLRTVF